MPNLIKKSWTMYACLQDRHRDWVKLNVVKLDFRNVWKLARIQAKYHCYVQKSCSYYSAPWLIFKSISPVTIQWSFLWKSFQQLNLFLPALGGMSPYVYEYYVITAGRNRVKLRCILFRSYFVLGLRTILTSDEIY